MYSLQRHNIPPVFIWQPYCGKFLFSIIHTFLPVPKQYSCSFVTIRANKFASICFSFSRRYAPASSMVSVYLRHTEISE